MFYHIFNYNPNRMFAMMYREIYTKGGIRVNVELFVELIEKYNYTANDFIFVREVWW